MKTSVGEIIGLGPFNFVIDYVLKAAVYVYTTCTLRVHYVYKHRPLLRIGEPRLEFGISRKDGFSILNAIF